MDKALNWNGKALGARIENVASEAEVLGIKPAHLYNLIGNRKRPSWDLLLRLQLRYGLTAQELTGNS